MSQLLSARRTFDNINMNKMRTKVRKINDTINHLCKQNLLMLWLCAQIKMVNCDAQETSAFIILQKYDVQRILRAAGKRNDLEEMCKERTLLLFLVRILSFITINGYYSFIRDANS